MTKQQPVALAPSPEHSTQFVTAWSAPSRTHDHVRYVVTYDRLANHFECQCPGYTYRGHCAHLQAAMDALVADWPSRARKGAAA